MNKKSRNKRFHRRHNKTDLRSKPFKDPIDTDLLNKQFEDLLTAVKKQTVQSLYQKGFF